MGFSIFAQMQHDTALNQRRS